MKRPAIPLILLCLASLSSWGCSSTMPPPHVYSMYTGPGTPAAKSESSGIEVFLDSFSPDRPYTAIGRVEIETENDQRTLENMLSYARAEARRMGGEGLVNITTSETTIARTGGYSYPVKNVVSDETMGVRTVGDGYANRRILRADVIVWK